jgi:serine/threonine-protein kinase RsbW
MSTPIHVKLVIPSRISLVDLVHVAAEKIAELAGFDEDERLNLGLAVREAAINAIKHGNGEDESKEVRILLEATGQGVKVEIEDSGPGFDPGGASDPTDADHLMETSGRGLLLIRAFVDDVSYEYQKGRGMQVTLIKELKTG